MNGNRSEAVAASLVAMLRQMGVELAADGDRLLYRPKNVVTEDMRSELSRYKAEILKILRSSGDQQPDSDVAWRVHVMRSQMPPSGPIPFLMARPEMPVMAGHCLSCGDFLICQSRSVCNPCVHAAWLTIFSCPPPDQTNPTNSSRLVANGYQDVTRENPAFAALRGPHTLYAELEQRERTKGKNKQNGRNTLDQASIFDFRVDSLEVNG